MYENAKIYIISWKFKRHRVVSLVVITAHKIRVSPLCLEKWINTIKLDGTVHLEHNLQRTSKWREKLKVAHDG